MISAAEFLSAVRNRLLDEERSRALKNGRAPPKEWGEVQRRAGFCEGLSKAVDILGEEYQKLAGTEKP